MLEAGRLISFENGAHLKEVRSCRGMVRMTVRVPARTRLRWQMPSRDVKIRFAVGDGERLDIVAPADRENGS